MSTNGQGPTAAMVAIGDELLSGRTRDLNIHYLANWLTARGVTLREVRIVQDVQVEIVRAVNDLRGNVDYVFTSGGIGPTHDDITADAIGAAFEEAVTEREDALDVLHKWYTPRGEEVTPARRRMARVPAGAVLIDNPVSGAPGFRMSNVYTMAGVPKIFQAMLEAIDSEIERGPVKQAMTVRGDVKESTIAAGLAEIEQAYDDLSIGSYPGKTGTGGPVNVVLRSVKEEDLQTAAARVAELMRGQGVTPEILQGAGVSD